MTENLNSPELFKNMPIGYMIVFSGNIIPENFVEVDGQSLQKELYPILFSSLAGTVIDCGSFFVLPTRKTMFNLFDMDDTIDKKIILKVQ